jgi:beta-mannosidase
MGSIYWQLNDCWPVASWASIDYYGRWKALHYYARRFYAPILISPNDENGIFQFYVISDKSDAVKAQLQVRLLDFQGAILSDWNRQILIRPHESAIYFSVDENKLPAAIDPRETLLYCCLENNGKVISENAVFFAPSKDLKLPLPDIDAEIAKDDSGFLLSLVSKNLARSVILRIKNCDGHFVDNFFDLYPGIKRTVRFLTQSKISEADFKKNISYLTLFELMEL